jgi:GNAT superfamily N-acetyltransferase
MSGGPASIEVRFANASDAAQACVVVRRSIEQLCGADHGGDPVTLAMWLENKTVDWFERLVASTSGTCVVAFRGSDCCGFGQIDHAGQVGLLYVDPSARFMDVSSRILARLEDVAAGLGLETVVLRSTRTAKAFYEARGYAPAGEPEPTFGTVRAWPLAKRLTVGPFRENPLSGSSQ